MICGQNVLRLKRWRDPCSGRSLFSYFLKESISLRWNSTSTYIYKWPQKRKKDKRQQTRSNEWIFKLPQVVTFEGGLKEKEGDERGRGFRCSSFSPKVFVKDKKKKPKKTKGVPKWINVHFLPIHTHTWVCVCVCTTGKKEKLDGSKIA